MEKASLGDALQNEDTLHLCRMVHMAVGCCLQNLISSDFCLQVKPSGIQPVCLSGYLTFLHIPASQASLSSYIQCRSFAGKCHPTEQLFIPDLQD